MAFRVDSERLGRVAARLDEAARTLELLRAGVLAEPAVAGAPTLTLTVEAAREWAEDAATDLRRRLGILEGQSPGTTAAVFAPTLGAATPSVGAFWDLAFTMCPPPEAVARLFAGMSRADALSVVARWPEAVGPLAGVPLGLRFAANRLLVRRELARVREGLRAGRLPPGGTAPVVARRRQALLESFRGRRILVFDWAGAGRIAEWHGPVDAHHVIVSVPGTGAAKTTFDRLADRSETLLRHDRSGDLAVVTALVYDAPGTLLAAARRKPARDGAPLLVAFLRDLRLEGRHITLLAHSYGSTVVGHAFGEGLGDLLGDDDDVVVIGSPGMGVGSVADLPHPPGHVWAARTEGDEVRWAVDPVAAIAATVCGPPVFDPEPVAPQAGGCAPAGDRLIHGPDPASAAFGARRFATGPNLPPDDWWGATEHGEYWATVDLPDGIEVPSVALANILAIATGRYGDVTS